MELTSTQSTNPPAITLTSSKVRVDNLAVGQQVTAKVIAVNRNGEIILSINNAILNAKSAIEVKEGQLLQLLVAQTGKQIVLQLPEKVLQQALSQQLLRESLPQQQPLNQTVQLLQQVLKQAKQLNLPSRLTQAMQNFVNRLPSTQQMSDGNSLRDVIKRSGVFLENSITQALHGKGKIATNDIKALLSQLRNSLTNERTNAAQQTQIQAQTKNISKIPVQNTQQTISPIIPTPTKQSLANSSAVQNNLQPTIKTNIAPASNLNPATPVKPTPLPATTIDNPSVIKSNIETALNIKASQHTTKTLGAGISPPLASGINGTSLPGMMPLTPGLTKAALPNFAMQYTTKHQAASIKEALALTTMTTTADVKEAGLVSRFSSLVDLIDQLIRQVDSSLARTQLHQLSTLQDQESGRLAWSLEVPVKQNDETHLVKLEIEKENAKNDSEAVVTVNIAVELEQLGPIHSRITLVGNAIGVVFWAEKQKTFELTRNAMSNLEDKLEKSGFDSSMINCHHGQPPIMRQNSHQAPENLLDIKV